MPVERIEIVKRAGPTVPFSEEGFPEEVRGKIAIFEGELPCYYSKDGKGSASIPSELFQKIVDIQDAIEVLEAIGRKKPKKEKSEGEYEDGVFPFDFDMGAPRDKVFDALALRAAGYSTEQAIELIGVVDEDEEDG